jgi:type II secretory pathway pseudopilin PulG
MLNQKAKSKAFTIVELLTVISVITLIIGLLVPALNKVNRIAKDMKQRAQFHSITTSLEMFKSENGEYPDSSEGGTSPNFICGAQKLAEALVGRDLQGFDPRSVMGDPESTTEAYGYTGTTYNQVNFEDSLDRRKGPYLNTDNLPIFDVGQIYTKGATPTGKVYPGKYDNAGNTVASQNQAPVITDIYKSVLVTLPVSGKSASAGTPVLYYKANLANKFNDISSGGKLIYDIQDNEEIVQLGSVKDGTLHKIRASETDEFKYFYEEMIANPRVSIPTANTTRPYRPDSYILISAGYDGIYGTNDDVTNYED